VIDLYYWTRPMGVRSRFSSKRPDSRTASCRSTAARATSLSPTSCGLRRTIRWRGRITTSATTPRRKSPHAVQRYVKETNRLYGVLNTRIADRDFIAANFSIADMASYPWVVPDERQGQNLDEFPHLKHWFETIRARPAVVRAHELAKEINMQPTVSEASQSILFGQTAAAVAR
jgi:glutathione S-transferase